MGYYWSYSGDKPLPRVTVLLCPDSLLLLMDVSTPLVVEASLLSP